MDGGNCITRLANMVVNYIRSHKKLLKLCSLLWYCNLMEWYKSTCYYHVWFLFNEHSFCSYSSLGQVSQKETFAICRAGFCRIKDLPITFLLLKQQCHNIKGKGMSTLMSFSAAHFWRPSMHVFVFSYLFLVNNITTLSLPLNFCYPLPNFWSPF